MSHLPDLHLKKWKKGDPLAAEDLNGNFSALHMAAEMAMTEARRPDPAGLLLETRLDRAEARLEALEHLTAMHARQRGEKEWAPLSYVAGVIEMVRNIREPLQQTVADLKDAQAEITAMRDNLDKRLARLELLAAEREVSR